MYDYVEEKMQLHEAIESVVRKIMAGSTVDFSSQEINGVTVTGTLFFYKTIGVSGILPVLNTKGARTKLVALYLKQIGHWYRVNFDLASPQTINATVDIVLQAPPRGLFFTAPIGWVKQKENGKFDFYSSAADSLTENYKKPDLTETVLKLAEVHESARKPEPGKTGNLI